MMMNVYHQTRRDNTCCLGTLIGKYNNCIPYLFVFYFCVKGEQQNKQIFYETNISDLVQDMMEGDTSDEVSKVTVLYEREQPKTFSAQGTE